MDGSWLASPLASSVGYDGWWIVNGGITRGGKEERREEERREKEKAYEEQN